MLNPCVKKDMATLKSATVIPANIYLLIANNRNTRKRCEIISELTIKTPESH